MSNDEVVNITKLTIKIGGKDIEVTLDEARKLKGALDEIFPAQVSPIQIHYINEPFYVPSTPYSPMWRFGDITTTGGYGNTCTATLSIEPESNIIT